MKVRPTGLNSNPWGFVDWYRSTVSVGSKAFVELVEQRRRRSLAVDRIANAQILAEVTQETLPLTIPPRINSEQTLALKLLKRFLNRRYARLTLKRPISIYLSLLAARIGNQNSGLTQQLIALANYCKSQADGYLKAGSYPDERNPRYRPDKFNDRWPPRDVPACRSQDLAEFSAACGHLIRELEKAKEASVPEISEIIKKLFGEQIGQRAIESFVGGYDRTAGQTSRVFEKGTGALLSSPALVETGKAATAPAQNYHALFSPLKIR